MKERTIYENNLTGKGKRRQVCMSDVRRTLLNEQNLIAQIQILNQHLLISLVRRTFSTIQVIAQHTVNQ